MSEDKVDLFLTMLCRDFDFQHAGMAEKRSVVERLLTLAELRIVPVTKFSNSEHDHSVRARAQSGADAPYDQDTCHRYPWAAAARIAHLEAVVATVRGNAS